MGEGVKPNNNLVELEAKVERLIEKIAILEDNIIAGKYHTGSSGATEAPSRCLEGCNSALIKFLYHIKDKGKYMSEAMMGVVLPIERLNGHDFVSAGDVLKEVKGVSHRTSSSTMTWLRPWMGNAKSLTSTSGPATASITIARPSVGCHLVTLKFSV
ncbi:hypothetical protein T439DRAFT_357670 [Meredithblackwellia eburnea MCA 4105]